MPAGPMPLGLAYFAAVKFAGYTAAGVWLNRRYGQSARTPFAFGMARTALGVAAGFAFGFLALGLGLTKSELAFYLLLAPIRLAGRSLDMLTHAIVATGSVEQSIRAGGVKRIVPSRGPGGAAAQPNR